MNNRRTAEALADQAGITEIPAEQLPADKADAIRQFTATGRTAMVGDGINDAPALASADVRIAVGATGSAAAVESAEVAFTGTDLRLIRQALAHARRGQRIMIGNIALSLGIIIVLSRSPDRDSGTRRCRARARGRRSRRHPERDPRRSRPQRSAAAEAEQSVVTSTGADVNVNAPTLSLWPGRTRSQPLSRC